MKLNRLITTNVALAFRIAGDLVVDMEYIKRDSTTFNFGDLSLNTPTNTSTVIPTIAVELKRKSRERNMIYKQIVVQSAGLGSISWYDKLKDPQDLIWNLGEIVFDNGFVVIANIYREGKYG